MSTSQKPALQQATENYLAIHPTATKAEESAFISGAAWAIKNLLPPLVGVAKEYEAIIEQYGFQPVPDYEIARQAIDSLTLRE